MSRQLTPAEKQLIEREFVAAETTRSRRRTFFRWVFVAGVIAGVAAAGLLEFFGRGILPVSFRIAWGLALIVYWRGAANRNSNDPDPKKGIFLLLAYPLSLIGFMLLSFALSR